jgi:phage/plasmid-associated DNA primase
MKEFRNLLLMAAAAAICVPSALAQDAPTTTTTTTAKPKYTINQRKQNQQQRIGEGVENGSLTAGEASHIEKQESHLNAEEKRMKSDGKLSAAERAKLQNQQNHLSKEIYNQKHDAQTQNLAPKSEVGQRQRNQQKRIGEGIENGSLTAKEASHLEKHEAGVNKEVAGMREANGGKLTHGEKKLVNRQENQTSKAIYRKKHNGRHRG